MRRFELSQRFRVFVIFRVQIVDDFCQLCDFLGHVLVDFADVGLLVFI